MAGARPPLLPPRANPRRARRSTPSLRISPSALSALRSRAADAGAAALQLGLVPDPGPQELLLARQPGRVVADAAPRRGRRRALRRRARRAAGRPAGDLDVDADLAHGAQRIQGEPARVGHVEVQPPRPGRRALRRLSGRSWGVVAQRWLAVWARDEAQRVRVPLQGTPQQFPEHAVRTRPELPFALAQEAGGARVLLGREQPEPVLWYGFQVGSPDVNGILGKSRMPRGGRPGPVRCRADDDVCRVSHAMTLSMMMRAMPAVDRPSHHRSRKQRHHPLSRARVAHRHGAQAERARRRDRRHAAICSLRRYARPADTTRRTGPDRAVRVF